MKKGEVHIFGCCGDMGSYWGGKEGHPGTTQIIFLNENFCLTLKGEKERVLLEEKKGRRE